jgi:hypothetical protein
MPFFLRTFCTLLFKAPGKQYEDYSTHNTLPLRKAGGCSVKTFED